MGKTGEERINEELGREISEREHVRAVLSCAIARVGQQYALTVRMIDPHTGSAVRSYLERANGQESVLPALDKIASRVRRDLGESLSSIQVSDRPLPQVTTGSIQALKQYADASDLWSKGKYTQSVQLDQNALELDADFAMAHAALETVDSGRLCLGPETCSGRD
jgi:hypothetical protein